MPDLSFLPDQPKKKVDLSFLPDKAEKKSFWEMMGSKIAPSERTQKLMQTHIPGMRDPFRMAGGVAVGAGLLDQPQLLATAGVGKAIGAGGFKELYEKDTRPSDLMGIENGWAKLGVDIVLDPINIPMFKWAKAGLDAVKAAKGAKKAKLIEKFAKELIESTTDKTPASLEKVISEPKISSVVKKENVVEGDRVIIGQPKVIFEKGRKTKGGKVIIDHDKEVSAERIIKKMENYKPKKSKAKVPTKTEMKAALEPKSKVVETPKVSLPEFNKSNTTEDALQLGKTLKGDKPGIEALKGKEAELKAKFDAEKDAQERVYIAHQKQLYREAREVAEGKMPEVTPGVKKATVKKPVARKPATKASTVNGWIKNQGGIKRKDLELYGIEDTNTKMLIGKNAADDLGARAVEEGVIPKPPKDMPLSDWLMEHRGKKAYEAIEHKTDKAIYESPEYVDYQYEELGKRGAIADDLTKDKFAEMLKKNKEPEAVHTGDLGVGDEFTIAGEKFKVTKQVGNELELKDGITKRVPDTFSEVTIDRGSLKKSAQKPKTSKEMEFYNEQVKKGRAPSMGKSLTPEERATAIAKRKAKLEKTGQKDVFGEAPGQGQKDIFKQTKSGKDFAKGLLKATWDGLGEQSVSSNLGGVAESVYKKTSKFISENDLKLTKAERDALIKYTTQVARKKLTSSEQKEAMIVKYIENIGKPKIQKIVEKVESAPPQIIGTPAQKGKIRKALENFVEDIPVKAETKAILRRNRGMKDKLVYQAKEYSKKRMKWWDKQGSEAGVEFMKNFQKKKVSKELQGLADEYKAEYDAMFRTEKGLSKKYNLSENADELKYIEDYWPQMWENPKKARAFMAKRFTGKAFFTKQRFWEDIESGMTQGGLKLKDTNPERVMLMRKMASFQSTMNKQVLKEMKDAGIIRFRFGNKPPSTGFVRLKSTGLDVHLPGGKSGYWEVAEHGAKAIENFLSPSLWSNPKWYGKVFRGASEVKNMIIATKLGLSGFHLIETGWSSMATQMAIAEKLIGRGKLFKGSATFLTSPLAPLKDLYKGHSLVRAWKTGKYTNELDRFFVEMIQRGGGRMDMGKNWIGGVEGQFANMVKDFRQMNVKGFTKGILRVVPSVVEGISKPIMSGWVPRLKASAYMNMVEDFVKHHPNITGMELDKNLAKMWDSVDNRFGQLVYDNLFFKKAAKDLGVFSQISMGWNIGTFREFGGAGIDFAKLLAGKAIGKKADIITDRMLYTLNYIAAFGTLGGIMHKTMTGKNPETIKDYFYPRTGKKLPDGSDERLQMPTMLKEAGASTEAFRKHGLVKGIAVYGSHKLQPMYSMIYDLAMNEDYFGTQIYDENLSATDNIMNVAEYVAVQGLLPISVSGLKRHYETSGEFSVKPLLGFNPAPRYITETKMQKEIFDLFGKRMGNRTRSRAEAERTRNKNEIRNLIRDGKIIESQELHKKYHKAGTISPSVTYKSIWKSAHSLSDQRAFKSLPVEDQKNLIKKMTEEEKWLYVPYSKKQVRLENKELRKYHKGGKK